MSNLRKTVTAMSSAGSLALILSGTAMAAPPTTFDNWSVGSTSAGIVTANTGICAGGSGFTCTTVADGAGFLQQEVVSTTPGGPRYVRTMIAEGFVAAAGSFTALTFASEDFVQLSGSATPGLASKMAIREGTASPTGTLPGSIVSGFSSSATVLSGWGTNSAANKSEAVLTLALSDWGADPDGAGALTAAAAGGDEFLTSFSVTANTILATGANVTTALGVDQTIYVGGPDTVANPTASQDRQRFVTLIENAATAQTAFKFAANTTDPATLSWVAGATPDKIQVVWAGQNIGGAGAFSTESVTKLSDGSSVRGSNLTSPNTFEWTTTGPVSVLFSEFGTAPTF
jgi:hypothetical protein